MKLKKIRKFFKKALAKFLKYKVIILILISFGLFTKTYHDDFLRAYVGNNVIKLFGGKSGGTGFFIKTPKGKSVILTNRHVCETSLDKKTMQAGYKEELLKTRVKILKMSDKHDLCAIESFKKRKGLKLANNVSIEDTVFAIGHPYLENLILSKGIYVSENIIRLIVKINVRKNDKCDGKLVPVPQNMFIFNMCVKKYNASRVFLYIRGGSSGSPLVNIFGRIVGVIFAGSRDDNLKNYAVPYRYVKEFLEEVDEFIK